MKKNVLICVLLACAWFTAISDYAFSNNQLASVTIGNNVTIIGERAFYGNQLAGLIIPGSVTKIGRYAFADNELTSILIESGTKFESECFTADFLQDYIRNSKHAGRYTKTGGGWQHTPR